MNLFFVALDDDNDSPDTVRTLVSEHYKDANYRLSALTWVIAADASPAEICQNLGIDKQAAGKKQATGVVALINDYSGYAIRAFGSS